MKRPGGVTPLLIAAALFAVAVGTYVALRPSEYSVRAGTQAPGFSLPVFGGGDVSLGALRGKVVFLNFWATWCAPCRDEAPSMQRLYDELRADGFEMLAVSIDKPADAAAIDEFRRDFSLTFPIPLDPTKRVHDAYRVSGVPETFLIDAKGRVLEHFIGPQNWADPRYSRAIRRALAAGRDSGGSPGG